jgi:glycosyltransferase involved in cell wall biosynthesis
MSCGHSHILVVIPAYNHSASLPQVVDSARLYCPNILVVDDGSTQALPALPEIDIVHHQVNLGKGCAILTAARWASERDFTHIITMDADGQHNPADLLKFIAASKASPYAIIVGARDFTKKNVPSSSKFGRAFSNFWLKVQTGISLDDVQSGFRAYPLAVLTQLRFTEKRYSFEVEVLVRAAWAGFPLVSINIDVFYPPKEKRISHFAAGKDNILISWLNTRLTLRSMFPWPHRRRFVLARERIETITFRQWLRFWLNQKSTPLDLAKSAFIGVFLSTLPLIGLHNVAIIMASGWIKINKAFALAIGHLCIPPIVPAIAIEAGHFMRHGEFLTDISMQTLGYEFLERAWEWIIGSMVLAPVLGIIVGLIIWLMTWCVQKSMHDNNEKDSFMVKP